MHVMSYLQNFLFTPDRARSPAKALSGGERARLLLARLFAQPSNLLVLDEPTNDLDVETLDLLEELIGDYAGTVLIVSHDRAFLDNVVTRCFVFGENGRIDDSIGGYADWLRQKGGAVGASVKAAAAPAKPTSSMAASSTPMKTSSGQLGSKEMRELEALPAKIEKLETEQAALTESLADPKLYQPGADTAKAAQLRQRLTQLEAELATVYARWEKLEALR
jgi:ATP-binding cassette subfamily F protein uup